MASFCGPIDTATFKLKPNTFSDEQLKAYAFIRLYTYL